MVSRVKRKGKGGKKCLRSYDGELIASLVFFCVEKGMTERGNSAHAAVGEQ